MTRTQVLVGPEPNRGTSAQLGVGFQVSQQVLEATVGPRRLLVHHVFEVCVGLPVELGRLDLNYDGGGTLLPGP